MGAELGPGESELRFGVGITMDGKILIDLGTATVNHLTLTVDQAFELAEELVQTGKQAMAGRVILPHGSAFDKG